MKKTGIVLVLTLAVLSLGADLVLRGTSQKTNFVSGTYANSQIDTLTWVRSATEAGATFLIQSLDSLCLDNVIVRRQFRGTLIAAIAGDTIITATFVNAATIKYATIPLTPYTDTLKLFVNYADSANGVTTATIRYGIGKAF